MQIPCRPEKVTGSDPDNERYSADKKEYADATQSENRKDRAE